MIATIRRYLPSADDIGMTVMFACTGILLTIGIPLGIYTIAYSATLGVKHAWGG